MVLSKYNINMQKQQNLDLDQQDFEFVDDNKQRNPDDDYFDEVVGQLQEIVIGTEFENMQKAFMHKHSGIFEDAEENKMEYMNIFKLYQTQIQKHLDKVLKKISQNLQKRVNNFSMEKFMELLNTRTDQIDEQLLDMLLSFVDFDQFKILMVDYRNYLEQQERIKLLTIKSTKNTETKKVKGANNIFNQNTFQLQKSPQAMLEELKKPQPKKKNKGNTLNIKQDEQGEFHPDLILSIKPLRKQ